MESTSIKKYVYPQLPSTYDLYLIRIGGSGLANCLFIAARGYILAERSNLEYINPTWGKISLGPYIRREKDKRHYLGLFNSVGIRGIKKIVTLWFKRNQIIKVEGLDNYFEDILGDYALVKKFINYSVRSCIKDQFDSIDFGNIIGVHVRLGDYVSSLRTNIDWYKSIIDQINEYTNDKFKFLLFSDGIDSEVVDLITIPNVQRVFYGNAMADIWALSKCKMIIGSDSTFSGWAAYLGQKPIVFRKCHFGLCLKKK